MNRDASTPDKQWTVAAIVADPKGAFAHIRQLTESRNAWRRKFDRAEKDAKVARRAAQPQEPPHLRCAAIIRSEVVPREQEACAWAVLGEIRAAQGPPQETT